MKLLSILSRRFSALASFRAQSALLFGGLVLVLTATLALVVYLLMARQAVSDQGQTLHTQAASTSVMLAEGLYERMREVDLLASSAALTQDGGGVIKPDGWLPVLEKMQETRPQFAWLGVTDAQGVVKVAAHGLLEGKDVSARPWFKAALKGPAAGDVHPAKLLATLLPTQVDNEPWRFIDFSAPLIDSNGTVVGVLGVHGSWRWAQDVIESLLPQGSRYEKVQVFILDKGGLVIHQPKGLTGLDKALSMPKGLAHGAAVMDWPDGGRYLTALARVPARNALTDLGWTVVVRQPPEVAIKLAVQVQKTVIAVGVVVGVLGVLMVWWLAGRLNRPLVDMARAADRIAAGDRSVHMGHHRGAAELMQVSAAVDHMTRELLQREQALVASRDELERKVRERTAELQASNAELARANTELDNLSRHDALTKLPNRRAADERLLHELARHRRSQTPLTLMVVDIDHFKAINDTHGHGVGDEVLAEVARRMSVTCRASDFVARMGGEEFLLILPDTDQRGGELLGRKVLEWVASMPVGAVPRVTISVGLVSLVPQGGMTPGPLIEAADQALYRAKNAGRNRVEVGELA